MHILHLGCQIINSLLFFTLGSSFRYVLFEKKVFFAAELKLNIYSMHNAVLILLYLNENPNYVKAVIPDGLC